eukprot:576430-Pelagomonas_calceolata.AAC.1
MLLSADSVQHVMDTRNSGMKPGYAKKKAKAKAKKQALKASKGQKQGENHDGDEMMVDADVNTKGVDNQGAEVDYEMHGDGEKKAQQGGSHKSKVEVSRSTPREQHEGRPRTSELP